MSTPAKLINEAQQAAGDMAVAAAENAVEAARDEDYATARRLNLKAYRWAELATKLIALEREAIEEMAR